jgi:steroid delta-isomerase-like uncharacterized protein
MSEAATIMLIRRYIDAFNAGDRDAMLACLSDDVAHDINEGERQIGKEKFRWFLGMMDRHYRERLEDVVVMARAAGGLRPSSPFTAPISPPPRGCRRRRASAIPCRPASSSRSMTG